MSAIIAGLGVLVATTAFAALATLVSRGSQALGARLPGLGEAAFPRSRRVWPQVFQSDLVPRLADRSSFRLAPSLALGTALCAWLAVPSPLRADAHSLGGATAVPSSISLGFFFVAVAAGSYVEFLAAWSARATLPILGAWRRLAVDTCGLGVLALLLLSVGLETRGAFPTALGDDAEHLAGMASAWKTLRFPIFVVALLGTVAMLIGRRPFDFEHGEEGVDPFAEFSGVSRIALYGARRLRALALVAAVIALAFGGGRWPFFADAQFRNSFSAATLPVISASLAFALKLALIVGLGGLIGSWFSRVRPRQAQGLALTLLLPLALIHLLGVALFATGGSS